MNYAALEIGSTGPAGYIGRGDEHHIDTKFSRKNSLENIVKQFDTLSRAYKKVGRNIEFSNPGVANLVYDENKPFEDKLSLIKRATDAHGHSVHSDFYSLDYYAPKIGDTRWDSSAEGAPIFVVGKVGSQVKGGSGGGYGNFAYALDDDGNILSKSGHGDTRKAVFSGGMLKAALPNSSGKSGGSDSENQTEAIQRVTEYITRYKNAKEVVDDLGNNFDQMKSQRLGAALQETQEDIINKRMQSGETFGTIRALKT
jgi:hypothetical protein